MGSMLVGEDASRRKEKAIPSVHRSCLLVLRERCLHGLDAWTGKEKVITSTVVKFTSAWMVGYPGTAIGHQGHR